MVVELDEIFEPSYIMRLWAQIPDQGKFSLWTVAVRSRVYNLYQLNIQYKFMKLYFYKNHLLTEGFLPRALVQHSPSHTDRYQPSVFILKLNVEFLS